MSAGVKPKTVTAQAVPPISDEEKEQVKQMIREKFGAHANNMIAVANCESGFNKSSVNWGDAKITGNPSWGVFQINRKKFDGWDNPAVNIQIAKEMFDRRGYQPWSCARRLGII